MTANYEPVLYWTEERESIRIKKERGDPRPWTKDPILAEWSFCCPRREDDRTTRWIDHNIRQPYAFSLDLWFMLCAARQINHPDTLAELIAKGAWPDSAAPAAELIDRIYDVLEERRQRGDKVYGAGYILSGIAAKGSKPRYTARYVLGPLWRDRLRLRANLNGKPSTRSLRRAVALLSEYDGWGAFLSYQAVVDMRFTRILRDASDVGNWAAAGPGTIRGLNRIHGRDVEAGLSQPQALAEMRDLYRVLCRELPGIKLDFSDVPNVLCETDKMLRARAGGKLKRRYVPFEPPKPKAPVWRQRSLLPAK